MHIPGRHGASSARRDPGRSAFTRMELVLMAMVLSVMAITIAISLVAFA